MYISFSFLFFLVVVATGFGLFLFVRRDRAQKGSIPGSEGGTMEPRNFRTRLFQGNEGDSLFLRALIVGGITLAMLIPLSLVREVVEERSSLHRDVILNISGMWGRAQTLSGPVIAVPYVTRTDYTEKVTDKDGTVRVIPQVKYSNRTKLVLPKLLNVEAGLNPQIRKRGIYEYVVYTSPVGMHGTFRLPEEKDFPSNVHRIDRNKAWVAVGLSDLRALTSAEAMIWNGQPLEDFDPGTYVNEVLSTGFHTGLGLTREDAGKLNTFAMSMQINGSGGIHFTPVGELSNITVSGAWGHPSFSGSLLPTRREIQNDSFNAEWNIPHLSRTYPQVGELGEYTATSPSGQRLLDFVVGVDLYETVSLYSQIERATKYGILFIGLTFIALMAFELLRRKRMHLVQYGMVGLAMALFYLVLLSLAEHSSFALAFAAASLVSVLMNGCYVAAALRSRMQGVIIMALLAGLYGLLYALLRMEDYTLLMGTALVLVVMTIMMYLTRNLPVDGGPAKFAAVTDSGLNP